ncbi:hypothetical protein BDD43_5953 [Mucilaginibacter gracilis]|uniref:Uncharacterized protein n=1 Tax=Mucilaginibacter gracilis TaxID=423350 RepID=A0A495JBE2_9SPHI|nr:hypothetical protein BDD43_5953 [Mucilaginibacter gracilis]
MHYGLINIFKSITSKPNKFLHLAVCTPKSSKSVKVISSKPSSSLNLKLGFLVFAIKKPNQKSNTGTIMSNCRG